MATSEFNVYMAELYQSFQAHDASRMTDCCAIEILSQNRLTICLC